MPGTRRIFDLSRGIQQSVRLFDETPTLRCHGYSRAAAANEKRIAKMRFDPCQRGRERRLRHIQHLGCCGQAAVTPDRAHIFILAQRDI